LKIIVTSVVYGALRYCFMNITASNTMQVIVSTHGTLLTGVLKVVHPYEDIESGLEWRMW